MYRYLAMTWSKRDLDGAAMAQSFLRRMRCASPSCTILLDADGTIVLAMGPQSPSFHSYRLADRVGIVIGTLFQRRSNANVAPAVAVLDTKQAMEIEASRGKCLLDNYWGRYVAFIRGPSDDQYVVRDPTGAITCYSITFDGVTLFFSDIADCLALSPRKLTINWPHICAFLKFDRIVSRATGFEEVTQVQAGECVAITAAGVTRSFHWSPSQVCSRELIEDRDEALQSLRLAVTTSVNSWASCYPRILHSLSGGLDSSIVLACLAEAQPCPHVVALNLYTETPEGDERSFARVSAEHAGCELVELAVRPTSRSLSQMLSTRIAASPTLVTLNPDTDELIAEIIAARRLDALFSGQGGDHLFQRRRNNYIAAEYAQRKGLRAHLLRVVLDTARLTGNPFWSVLRDSTAFGLLRGQFDPYQDVEPPDFVRADGSGAIPSDEFRHPWLSEAADLPIIKRQQILDIIDCQNMYSVPWPHADLVHPLMSQPVIECCLRIPSYVLTTGGRERSLARMAFSKKVPHGIITRYTKGAATGHMHSLIRNSSQFVRDLLLDGALVRNGLLDRGRLEQALSASQLVRQGVFFSLLTAVRAESWLRTAADPQQQIAA